MLSPLQLAISALRKKLSIGSPLAIEVRRDYVLIDALKEAGKKKFDVNKKIKVSVCKYKCTCIHMCMSTGLTLSIFIVLFKAQTCTCTNVLEHTQFITAYTCMWEIGRYCVHVSFRCHIKIYM